MPKNKVNDWQVVVFSGDCDEDGNCPMCNIDFGDCDCPGPTMDDEYEYQTHGGILFARRKADAN